MSGFRPNLTFESEMRRDPRTMAALREVAEQGRKGVERAALGFRRTGYFSRSLRVITDASGKPVISSSDPFAHLIEWGSSNNPAYSPFRRGIRAAGLDLRESPKS